MKAAQFIVSESARNSDSARNKGGHGRKVAGAAVGALAVLGLAAGFSACSSSSHGAQPGASHAPQGTAAPTKSQNPGGAMRPAPPAEAKKALSSYGAYNPMEFHGAYSPAEFWSAGLKGALTRLLTSLPLADLPEVSNNWSGYQVLGARTHVAAASASGTWVVPKVSAPSKSIDGFSSIWVGIGGSCLDVSCKEPDQSLIQLGTSEAASPSGQNVYNAWYEILPAAEVVIPSLTVAPGDKVTASLGIEGAPGAPVDSYNPMSGVWGGRYNPAEFHRTANDNAPAVTETWVLSITLTTPSGKTEHWSKTLSYASSLASAEWIVEGPSAMCNGTIGEQPLADYHSVGFSQVSENAKAPSFGLSNLVVGYDPFGELSLPVPSFLLHGKTATYYVPFVPKGSAEAAGKASCNAYNPDGGRVPG